mmetsp:Transcript_16543/g.32880  ORF Transcript_16543/g.32880 Transcript_16543/m.32880 type:complete len:83 (+) Transcript_16543:329-577(+)
MIQITPKTTKTPPKEIHSARERRVLDMIVAVKRLQNVAMLIPLARIVVENTSEGINQAPGPMPMLKDDKYMANPTTDQTGFK